MSLTVNSLTRYKGLSGSSPQPKDSGITDAGKSTLALLNPAVSAVSANL